MFIHSWSNSSNSFSSSLARGSNFPGATCFGRFFVLGIFWSFLLVKMCVRYYVIGSKHIKYVCQSALLLVQSTLPNILTSLDYFFLNTRSCAALRAADLDWIVGKGYGWGGYILGCSQYLASCLRHSARICAGSQLTSG